MVAMMLMHLVVLVFRTFEILRIKEVDIVLVK